MFKYASRFRADPYGWLTNQVSHMGGGLAYVFASCYLWLAVFGEFPVRWHIWAAFAVVYLAWEIAQQGWQGADTIEDWCFVVAYGAGGPLLVFREYDLGSGLFYGQIHDLRPFFALACVHLVIGVAIRIVQARS